MKRYVVLVLAAAAAACAGRTPPRAAVAPARGPAHAPVSDGAASPAVSRAVVDTPPEERIPPAPVLDSIIDAEIAAELKLEADSAADAAVLDQINAPDAGRKALAAGKRSGGALAPHTVAEVKDEASELAKSTVTWDIDVTTYGNHERVKYWLDFFQDTAHDRFQIWLHRLPKYEPMIRERLKERGLPTDLVYLALIESGMSNQAVSRANAVGMWQFMRGTAKGLGMRVDGWVDERRDPMKATVAASRYLSGLYKQFGSLYLAAAAYNAGGGRISRTVKRLPGQALGGGAEVDDSAADDDSTAVDDSSAVDDSTATDDSTAADSAEAAEDSAATADSAAAAAAVRNASAPLYSDATFFRLYDAELLHQETRDYVPKLIAAALIAKEPARYGFTVPDDVKPLAYDSMIVTGMVGLDVVARLSDTTLAAIRELNPQYLRLITPPGARSVVRVPVGRGARTFAAYEQLPPSKRVSFLTHVVRRRETLRTIAVAYGVPESDILRANARLHGRKRLRAGTRLVIPTGGIVSPVVARTVADPAPAGRREAPLYHKVRRGESLSVIAQRYEVSQRELRSWNHLGAKGHIRIGQRLRVTPPGGAARSARKADEATPKKSRTTRARGGTKLAAATAEATDATTKPTTGSKAAKTTKAGKGAPAATKAVAARTHVVRRGETLMGVANRYGVSVQELAAANHLNWKARVKVGQRLKIPA